MPQCAQTVRNVGFPSARQELPLVGKTLLATQPDRRSRPDDPDIPEQHEVVVVVPRHGTLLLRESAPSTRERTEGPCIDRVAGL